ncbi:MAG: hypothetical protein EDM05_017840 [Leptolyngbya sp. IPPAS B-1204]|uniref:Uncharacterized protein n=1 Tax=Leptolyngbya sp. NK1-12 TaxID=2547451 RepID=A0AA97AFE7_9CYAN|nr:hypothetical protein [Leptolyngbya sp. NK1-12]MBF2045909.1 hypothetical protein [Elainella sp. C42_A2020_010]RNJ69747.1 MAG: hypothetical protein EDM05_07705 [Leptolyngbya sp. IPPAS B-1204]WNZ22229.1 hypothetical protein HJG54_04685 [Leptolyngbya sp. NK1-12]
MVNDVGWMTQEDWFNVGKEDAWFKRPKHPPEQDPQAASLYDLGYSEGVIERPPTASNPIETRSSTEDH